MTVQLVDGKQRYDKNSQFQDPRYISALEVPWRLFQFELIDKNTTVLRLDFHTENNYTVFF